MATLKKKPPPLRYFISIYKKSSSFLCSRSERSLTSFSGPCCLCCTKCANCLPDSAARFTKTHTVCRSKGDDLCFHPSWRTIKLKQISSTVHGQVALAATVGLRAIKLRWRWRAFRSRSRTYRSNGDKWDVTALVKQGYNLSKSNIICDPTWHPLSLFFDIWIQWLY